MKGGPRGDAEQAFLEAAWANLTEAQRAEITEVVKAEHPSLRRFRPMLLPHCYQVMRVKYGIEPPVPRAEEPGPAKAQTLRVFGDWPEPEMEGPGPAPPFPVDIFPAPLADFIREASRFFPSPSDYFAIPALAIAGGAIGRSVAIRIKDTWVESPVLFAATIGPPGSVKSPALKLMAQPVWKISRELRDVYEEEVRQANERRREAKEIAKKLGGKAGAEDDAPRPKLRRALAEDLTCESISRVLAENPRGFLVIHDELSGWVNAMNQYKGGSGSDRQFWLKIWALTPIAIDRVANENNVPIVVPHPFLPVVGAITPDMLDGLSEGEKADGFIDRILLSYPDPIRTRWSWRSVSAVGIESWEKALRRLWGRPLLTDKDGDDHPAFVRFTRPALHKFARWFDGHQRETESPEFPKHLVGPWSKYRAYCCRLALILDQLQWAYSDEAVEAPDARPCDVGPVAVAGAIRLIDDYFKPHFRRALTALQPGRTDNPDARAIIDWAIGRRKATFTMREALGNFRRRFEERPDDFPAALLWLTARHAIRRLLPPVERVTGRRPSDAYEVNPHLLVRGGRAQNTRNSDVLSWQ